MNRTMNTFANITSLAALVLSLVALYFAIARNYWIWKRGYLQGYEQGYQRGLRDAPRTYPKPEP
jgi:hypothetical protein